LGNREYYLVFRMFEHLFDAIAFSMFIFAFYLVWHISNPLFLVRYIVAFFLAWGLSSFCGYRQRDHAGKAFIQEAISMKKRKRKK